MEKTIIFFEPQNNKFFIKIAKIYRDLIIKNYTDAIKMLKKEDSIEGSPIHEKLLKNYFNDLIFPACDFNDALTCDRITCTFEKCPVLTGDQKDQVIRYIKNAKKTLSFRSKSITDNIIINKIINKCLVALNSKKVKSISHEHGKSFDLYLNAMNKINNDNEFEEFVYVSSNKNSDYPKFRARTTLQPLNECAQYQ
ncbi:MAG: hypothetical protein FWB95_01490 [Treponema sp.]|nr:hypothetical protein [Treponema sp.]